jgi:hypothetical protein
MVHLHSKGQSHGCITILCGVEEMSLPNLGMLCHCNIPVITDANETPLTEGETNPLNTNIGFGAEETQLLTWA